jgi:hypothetical protein
MFYNMLRTTVTNFRFLDQERPARIIIGATAESCVTKRPLDIFDIDNILVANALAKTVTCVILIRDIRSIVTSRHQSVTDDYFIGFDRQYFVNIRSGQRSYTNPGVMQTHVAIAHARQRQDLECVSLKYEDILRDPDAVQDQLGTVLGFRYSGRFNDFHRHETPEALTRELNTLRAPDIGNAQAWRAPMHRQRIKDQFTRCPRLFELLKIYGYETDDRWFDSYREE